MNPDVARALSAAIVVVAFGVCSALIVVAWFLPDIVEAWRRKGPK